MASKLGQGLAVSFSTASEVEGTVAVVRDVQDSLGLLDLSSEDLAQTILWVPEPVVTLVAPVLEHVAGVLCATGGPAAHVAIVARELGLPCLMQFESADSEPLEGARLTIRRDGTVWA